MAMGSAGPSRLFRSALGLCTHGTRFLYYPYQPLRASILDLLRDDNEFHISQGDKESTSHSPAPLTLSYSYPSSQAPFPLLENTVEVF